MTTFLLIRHGHTAWIGHALAGHSTGVGLNDLGHQQAASLASRLGAVPLRAIYSSPLQRTLETAAPLARATGLPVQQRPRLIEVDFGKWTGKTMVDLASDPQWQAFNAFRSVVRAPGGELMLEVQSRMVTELEELRTNHPEETVAIVSHQDSIKAALAHYAGIPLDLFQRIEISPASVSIVRLSDFAPRLLCINDGSGVLAAS